MESVIHTNECKGFSKLPDDLFRHRTVNNSNWFVDPYDRANTQGIEITRVQEKH